MDTPWVVDADTLAPTCDFALERTAAIEQFLGRTSNRFAVVAPKGFGKTLLLNAKRNSLPTGYTAIPAGALLDKPSGDRVFGMDEVRQLDESHEPWKKLWRASIAAAVVKAHRLVRADRLSPPLAQLLEEDHLNSSADFFINLLRMNPSRLFKVAEDTDSVLVPAMRNLDASTAVFIDSVDEYFNKHRLGERHARQTDGEVSPRIWSLAQVGLLVAAWELRRATHHLKVFVTLRKEALGELVSDPMQQQYMGSVVQLEYSKSDLRRIFCSNIQAEDKDRLIEPAIVDRHPVRAFLGSQTILHRYVRKNEDAFDYIYRHTFKRPRDLATIGGNLSAIDPEARDATAIRDEVNRASSAIAKEYLAEIAPHLGDADLKTLWRVLPQGTMKPARLAAVAAAYDEQAQRTNGGSGAALLGALYRAGLLGIVHRDGVADEIVQRFESPGALTVDTGEPVPEAYWYVMHPALSQIIANENPRYLEDRDRENIIGDAVPWQEPGEAGSLTSAYVLRGDVVNFSRFMNVGQGVASKIQHAIATSVRTHATRALHQEVTGGDALTVVADDADALVRIARRIQEDLYPEFDRPELRMAIVRGPIAIAVGDDGASMLRGGLALRIAARVERLVEPGEIWVDRATSDALETCNSYYTTERVAERSRLEKNAAGEVNVAKPDHNEEPVWMPLYEIVQRHHGRSALPSG